MSKSSPLKHKSRDLEAHRLSSGYASFKRYHKNYPSSKGEHFYDASTAVDVDTDVVDDVEVDTVDDVKKPKSLIKYVENNTKDNPHEGIPKTKDAKEDAKETVKEYKNPVKADMSGGDDKSAKSPVSSGPKVKSAASGVKTGSGAADTGRAAPSTGNMKSGDFENTGGKAKSTSFKKQEKADSKDGSDKSAKSPVAGK